MNDDWSEMPIPSDSVDLRTDVERYRGTATAMLAAIPSHSVVALAELILDVTCRGNSVYVFGNGGSAATADHIACDLSKNTRTHGAPAVRCISLASATPLLTAVANDEGLDEMFAGPLRAYARPGDLALAVSASGMSANVVRALHVAREMQLRTAALLGFGGGLAATLVDLAVVVSSDSVPHIEDAHCIINHMLTHAVREWLKTHVHTVAANGLSMTI